MILSLLSLFVKVRELITGLFVGLFQLVAKYPIPVACLVALVITNIVTYNWSATRTETKVSAKYEKVVKDLNAKITDLTIQIKNYETLDKVRQAKIKELEESTVAAAESYKKAIDQATQKLVTLDKSWSTKLSKEIKVREASAQSVKVVNPVTKQEVNVTLEGNEVVCSRFHDSFSEGINDLVREVNQTLQEVN